MFLFPFVLHECWAVADEPVEVSDMEDPEDENGGSDLSEGDGEGAFRCIWPITMKMKVSELENTLKLENI